LTKDILKQAVESGLTEITVSVHGFTRETYESMMTNGNFDLFRDLLLYVADIKKKKPAFKLRINYTANKDNIDELSKIWEVTGDDTIDILQIRPVQKIGETVYNDFDLDFLFEKQDTVILPVIEECRKRKIICIAPQKENVLALKDTKDKNMLIEQAVYCYVSPQGCWHDDFDYHKDTFESFSSKHKLARHLFWGIFKRFKDEEINVSRKMNYRIS
jgi:MoaA/NifB/PqqE/SkfB family radical SAM enzyme